MFFCIVNVISNIKERIRYFFFIVVKVIVSFFIDDYNVLVFCLFLLISYVYFCGKFYNNDLKIVIFVL